MILAQNGYDRITLLAAPAALFLILLFIYPFLYGLVLSFEPPKGDWLANYVLFFSSDRLWPTIWTTLKLALPATRCSSSTRRSSSRG